MSSETEVCFPCIKNLILSSRYLFEISRNLFVLEKKWVLYILNVRFSFVFRTFSQDFYVGYLESLLRIFNLEYLFYRAPLKTTSSDAASLFKYLYFYYYLKMP